MRINKSLPYYLALLILFFFARDAYALTITPIRIEVSGNPGQVLTENITLTNEQKTPTTFYSSFANFEAQGESGNPSFTDATQDLASWMSTDASIHLDPNESKTVKVKIIIPNDAEPGGHFAAAFFGTFPSSSNTAQVGIGAKTGALILLSVNGSVKEAGGLLDFSTKDHKIFYNTLPVSFVYRFKNDGGDRIKPVGKITMHDLVYLPADRIDANPSQGNILPGSTRRFEVEWLMNGRSKEYVAPSGAVARFFDQAGYQFKNFAVGPYFARVNLLYGTEGLHVTKTAFFFVFPWQMLLVLIVILFAIWWIGRKLLRRYNRHIIKKARQAEKRPSDAHHG
jgi:hypothetical protein